jgi:hypothetical protein
MFWSLFDKLGLGSKDLIPHKGSLIGFIGDTIMPKGYVDLKVLSGQKPSTKAVMTIFNVVDCPSAYIAILGRPTLNHLGAIVSTIHLAMKFPKEDVSIVRIRGKSSDARRCYQESLKIAKMPPMPSEIHEGKGKKKMEHRDLAHDAGVMITNLDPRADFEEKRSQSEGDQILVHIRPKEGHNVKVGANLPSAIRERLIELLKRIKDLRLGLIRYAGSKAGFSMLPLVHQAGMPPCSPEETKNGTGKDRSY